MKRNIAHFFKRDSKLELLQEGVTARANVVITHVEVGVRKGGKSLGGWGVASLNKVIDLFSESEHSNPCTGLNLKREMNPQNPENSLLPPQKQKI